MKKILALFLVLMFTFGLSACRGNDKISKAANELENHWEELYDDSKVDTDGYFEIKNTRVIKIKDNDIDEFKDVDYIVEFVLYTDYFGSAPYYQNVGLDDTVVVYKDGTMKVQRNSINLYRAKTFKNDFSDFIKTIDDYGDKYNCSKNLK